MGLFARVGALVTKRQVLWTLVKRDLRVRYARSWLGYLWTILDPLAMSGIYFLVFVHIFRKGDIGHAPYFLFLVIGLLTWQWFSAAITDTTRALLQEARLVRSTNLPREIWVVRVVIAKAIEYALSLPVLALFVIGYAVQGSVALNARLLLFPVGVLLLFLFLIGAGLLLAPVTALVTDTQRVVRIALRMFFYGTPIIYALDRVPSNFETILWLNPLTGILELQRAGFFDAPVAWGAVGVGAAVTLLTLAVGWRTFVRLERAVLKEI